MDRTWDHSDLPRPFGWADEDHFVEGQNGPVFEPHPDSKYRCLPWNEETADVRVLLYGLSNAVSRMIAAGLDPGDAGQALDLFARSPEEDAYIRDQALTLAEQC